MAFIEINGNKFSIDDSDLDENPLIGAFSTLIENNGFDKDNVSCGVTSGPDFGYFTLASRFWRASLCIYFSGITHCFWESGAGYPEPWLFNARHSIELHLKGFVLFVLWFEELQDDIFATSIKLKFKKLQKQFKKPHSIYKLYNNYQKRIENLLKNWDTEKLSDPPKLNKMLLSKECKEILAEIDEADTTSFTFRYPSLQKDKVDHLQKLAFNYDESELLPKTGLPKKFGYYFDHLKVINNLHILMKEMKSIGQYLRAGWDYIGEIQDFEEDRMNELYSMFENEMRNNT